MPEYFGCAPGSTFWIYKRTLAVSIGIVQVSPNIPAAEAIKTFLMKKAKSPSPAILLVYMILYFYC